MSSLEEKENEKKSVFKNIKSVANGRQQKERITKDVRYQEWPEIAFGYV